MRLDDAFDDSQAQAGPLGLGGVKRLEQLLPLIGREARAVVPDRDRDGGSTVDRGLEPVDVDLDRVAASGQGVVEDVAKDLDHPEAVGRARSVEGGVSAGAVPLVEPGVPAAAARLQAVPGLVQQVAQPAGLAVEDDRSGVAADLLEEAVQVVLGLLYAVDQVEGLAMVLQP